MSQQEQITQSLYLVLKFEALVIFVAMIRQGDDLFQSPSCGIRVADSPRLGGNRNALGIANIVSLGNALLKLGLLGNQLSFFHRNSWGQETVWPKPRRELS